MLGAPIRAGSSQPSLGCDHQVSGIGPQTGADQPLAGPVGIGCIDEVDTELDRALEDPSRLIRITGEAHGSEAKPVDGPASDVEGWIDHAAGPLDGELKHFVAL